MTDLRVIPTPIGAMVRPDHVRAELLAVWPHAPGVLLTTLTRLLTHPRVSSDALLCVADGLGGHGGGDLRPDRGHRELSATR